MRNDSSIGLNINRSIFFTFNRSYSQVYFHIVLIGFHHSVKYGGQFLNRNLIVWVIISKWKLGDNTCKIKRIIFVERAVHFYCLNLFQVQYSLIGPCSVGRTADLAQTLETSTVNFHSTYVPVLRNRFLKKNPTRLLLCNLCVDLKCSITQ
jgi:hypothetical protein